MSPAVLQSLLQQLLFLHRVSNPPYASAPNPQVQNLVLRVRNSEYGRMDESSLRAEYGCGMEASDNLDDLVLAVFGEGVTRMLRVGSLNCRTWVLHNALEVTISAGHFYSQTDVGCSPFGRPLKSLRVFSLRSRSGRSRRLQTLQSSYLAPRIQPEVAHLLSKMQT